MQSAPERVWFLPWAAKCHTGEGTEVELPELKDYWGVHQSQLGPFSGSCHLSLPIRLLML